MDAQDDAGAGADGGAVILARVRLVLPTSTSSAPDWATTSRSAAPADLHQLAAGDDHPAARPGQRRHRQQHRGGAVVDHQGVLGPGERDQQGLGRRRAASARR